MKVWIHSLSSFSACLFLSTLVLQAVAQTSGEETAEVLDWAKLSLYQLTQHSLALPTEDLEPLRDMIGSAKIVALSESLHSAAEPLAFRNRMFKFLVEELGFKTIVLESGLVESRSLNDYVVHGQGSLDLAIAQGISHGFDQFQQNHELIRWVRQHNVGLPDGMQKVQIFGMDVSGSPGNLGATRKPDTALRYVLDYLDEVDPETASSFHRRIDPYLPILASTNDYGSVTASERDSLTAAIEDIIALIQRRKFAYTARKTAGDYQWAERAAVSSRQVDSWFRQMPDGWILGDGLAWTSESQLIRDRVMADNLDWVLNQLDEDERVFVFASVGHIAAVRFESPNWMQEPEDRSYTKIPFGAYAKAKYQEDFVNVFNMLFEGAIYFCQSSNPSLLDIGTPEPTWAESVFASVGIDAYLLDFRSAPSAVSNWLQQERDHRNIRASTSEAFDILYYVKKISSDCVVHSAN